MSVGLAFSLGFVLKLKSSRTDLRESRVAKELLSTKSYTKVRWWIECRMRADCRVTMHILSVTGCFGSTTQTDQLSRPANGMD